MSESEDDQWHLHRARQRSADFAPLYHRYFAAVSRFCACCLDDPDRTRDATSLTFANAVSNLASCPDGEFRPWLFNTAWKTIGEIRRDPSDTGQSDAALRDAGVLIEGWPVQHEGLDEIDPLLSRLPNHQRQVVALRLADLTSHETAHVLDRPDDWVRRARHRAVRRLRELLDEDGGAVPV